MIHCFFLGFSSLVITKEGTWWNLIGCATLGIILAPVSHQSLSTMINLHTEHTRTPNRCQNNSQSSKSNEIPSGSFLCDDQRWKFKKKQWIMITPKVSQYINLYECPEHVDLSTFCLIILVTINAMDIVWYYGVGGAPMEKLIMNAQYMWTHPPLV